MATANEDIRDALVKRQIMLVKESGKVSREILAMLDDAHGDLKKRIDDRLKAIANSGQDTGEATTRRLLALERSLRAILRRPHRRINARVRKALKDIAINDPKIVSGSIKAGLPVVITNTVPSAKQLRAIVETLPVDGTPLKAVLGNLETGTVDAIMAGVRRGLTLGEGIAALRQRVRKVLDTTRKRAEAIVRTAANSASNRARQIFFKENAKVIQSLMWVATLDDRTCVYCGAQDGKRFKPDKGPRPPAHINCRCTMVATIDGRVIGDRPLKRSTEEDLLAEYAEQAGIKPVKRRASLPRGHKGNFDKFSRRRVRQLTGQAPASETFDEFLRKQSPAFQDKVLREQVAEWYRKRRIDLDDLFDDNGEVFSIDEILRRRPDLREAA